MSERPIVEERRPIVRVWPAGPEVTVVKCFRCDWYDYGPADQAQDIARSHVCPLLFQNDD